MSNKVNRRKRKVKKRKEVNIDSVREKSEIIYTSKCRYDFEKVDIFLRVKGRLPNQDGDGLTQEILDEYCDRYEKGKLTEGIVPLGYMYQLIKNGTIKINL